MICSDKTFIHIIFLPLFGRILRFIYSQLNQISVVNSKKKPSDSYIGKFVTRLINPKTISFISHYYHKSFDASFPKKVESNKNYTHKLHRNNTRKNNNNKFLYSSITSFCLMSKRKSKPKYFELCSELSTKTRWRSTTKTRAFIKGHYKILNTHTILKYTPFDFTLLNTIQQRTEEAKRNKTGTQTE